MPDPIIVPCATEADWHAERTKAIGASEIPDLCGVGFRTPFQLWHLKKNGIGQTEETERMRAGKFLEAGNAEWYAFENRERYEVVTPQAHYGHPDAFAVIVRHPTLPIQCTPDRILIDRATGAAGVLQLKNTDTFVEKKLWIDDEPPLRVQAQIQAEMLCTGLAFGAIGTVVGGNKRRDADVQAIPDFQRDLGRLAAAFWLSLERDEPPAVEAGDAQTVAQVWPKHEEGKEVELPRDLLFERAMLKREIKAREQTVKLLDARIASALGDAEFGTIDYRRVVSYKTTPGGKTVNYVTRDSRALRTLKGLEELLPAEEPAPHEQPIFPE